MKAKLLSGYFTKAEKTLWCASMALIAASFCIFDRTNYLTLTASFVGVTSLIFCAKGNPFGQLLMIVFSVIYGVISLRVAYYGEMITYLGMTAPMAAFALVFWLRNPSTGNRAEVAVNRLRVPELILAAALTAGVTAVFYWILKAFHTANLVPSTISVATSFLAAYLTFRRSAYFALAYAANDLVLIVLWGMASAADLSCISVVRTSTPDPEFIPVGCHFSQSPYFSGEMIYFPFARSSGLLKTSSSLSNPQTS